MHVIEFTEEKRRELYHLGERNLHFFCKGILGMKDLDDDLHLDLAVYLTRFFHPSLLKKLGIPSEHRLNRGAVVAFRGSLKSSIANQGLALHQGIYVHNHSTLVLEQKFDNAAKHFKPLVRLFQEGARADFLQWLYQGRIPEGFRGWTSEELSFLRTDPLALPSIFYGGMDSALEGIHVNLIIADDPEGADESKANAPNAEAWSLLTERCPPLLINPDQDRILLIGTPHGPNPCVWRLREDEQARKVWAIFWRPLVDPTTGKVEFSKRFTANVVASLKVNDRLFRTQYQLEKAADRDQGIDLDQVLRWAWERLPGARIAYERDVLDWTDLDERGAPAVRIERNVVGLGDLRFYLHADPKHKEPGQAARPSEAAIVVVGVAPDFHAFTIEDWGGDVGLEEFVRRLYHFYRKYLPAQVTFESVGAQRWLLPYVQALEKTKFRELLSLPLPGRPAQRMPRLSSKLVEAEKTTQKKLDFIVEGLTPWLYEGRLHVGRHHKALLAQMEAVGSETALKDRVDALAQGPPFWRPPVSAEALREIARRKRLADLLEPGDPVTGYRRPWCDPARLRVAA